MHELQQNLFPPRQDFKAILMYRKKLKRLMAKALWVS